MRCSKCLSLITCLFMLLASICVVFTQYNEYLLETHEYHNSYNSINYEEYQYINTILIENKEKAESILDIKKDIIIDEIQTDYDSDEELIYDITNPSDDSKLSNILNDNLESVYINKDNKNNTTFAASIDLILWDKSSNIISTNNRFNKWEDFNSYKFNSELAESATSFIKGINYNSSTIPFWQISDTDNKIYDMSLEALYDTYKQYGLGEMKNYEILIPVYITDTGDIFGTPDVSNLGNINKNYKIIIVQRINVYDALEKYQLSLEKYNEEMVILEERHEKNLILRVRYTGFSVIALMLLYTISALFQNKIVKKGK